VSAPRLGLHLTDRCQLDCDHCLRDPASQATDLDVGLALRVAREALALHGTRHASLTGGEPLLHPELQRLLSGLEQLGYTWDVVTNGLRVPLLLTELAKRADGLRALRSLSVSLDGATAAAHDAVRGAGSFVGAMTAIAACTGAEVPFGVQMAVHARNAKDLEAVGILAAQLGAKHVSFALTQPTGTPLDTGLRLEAGAWRELKRRIEALSRVLAISVVLPEGHYEAGRGRMCGPLAGETLHVDAHGGLSLCCLHSEVPAAEARASHDLATMTLAHAERFLLEDVHRARVAALEDAANTDEWSGFECNSCLRRHGMPHWTSLGVGGATAERSRWREDRAAPHPVRLRTVS
jgi:MoaA/NifB/PqqE/SkfB family radical SAM enzyme